MRKGIMVHRMPPLKPKLQFFLDGGLHTMRVSTFIHNVTPHE